MAPIGIINIGNSCYMNSILQIFFNHPIIYKLIMSCNDLEIKKEFIMYHTNENCYNPKFFKKKINQIFNNIHQNDAHEFLSFLIEYLDKELKIINYSNFLDIINFQQIVCINNINKKKKSYKTTIDNILILEQSTSLSESYDKYTTSTYIHNYKDSENNICTVKNKISVVKWANLLIIMFMKYMNKTKIKIPIYWTIHNKYNDILYIVNYVIFGAIIHYGDNNRGHYVCILNKNDKYFLCNDTMIDEISIESFINYLQNSYICFYNKVT